MLKDQLDKEHRKFFQLLFVRRRERNSPLELTTGRGHTRSVFLEADRQTDTSLSLSLSLARTKRKEHRKNQAFRFTRLTSSKDIRAFEGIILSFENGAVPKQSKKK